MVELGFHCNRISHIERGVIGNGLRRGEFFCFRKEELPALKKEIEEKGIKASVHSPLIRLDWYPWPHTISFLCNISKDDRELTLRMIRETIDASIDIGAEYIIVHFPAPATDTQGESEEKRISSALKGCEAIAELSVKKNIPIHTEGIGSSELINLEFLKRVFTEFDILKYCFDIGHMKLASIELGFDLYEFAEGILPYLGSVHIWNLRTREDYERFHHIPVHPSQKAEDGWVDIERILKILSKKPVPFIFESPYSYPEELGGYDYREGVEWVKGILSSS